MKIFLSSLLLLTALLMPVNVAYAADKVVICHVLATPPQTIEVAQSALSAHLAHGDTLGACPEPPVVPEFGLITGGIAMLASGGAFLLLKRRTSKS